MSKALIKILFLCFLAIIFLILIFWKFTINQNQVNYNGDYVFYDTEQIDGLNIYLPEYKISLSKVDGVWLNDDGYYVDNRLVDNFLSQLKNAFYVTKAETKPNLFSSEVVLSSATKPLLRFAYHYDAEKNKNYISFEQQVYEINQHFELPQNYNSWFTQPLLPFNNQEITEINPSFNFDFSNLIFYQALKKQQLDLTGSKNIFISLDNGLEINLMVFKYNDQYWVEVKLASGVLPTKEATRFLKYNNPLYDGWIFQISDREGAKLYNL